MTVRMSLGGHTDVPFQFGRYKVDSDTPTADRTCRDVVAYDALYDILNADVAAWYNTVFPSHKEQQKDKDGKTTTVTVYDPVTMKQFRDSFLSTSGLSRLTLILSMTTCLLRKQLRSRHPVRQVLIQRNRAS